MAWDFFQVSPTYRERVSSTIQKRRTIVASFCDSGYRLPKGSGKKVKARVESEIAGLSGTSIYNDIHCYKAVKSWLEKSEPEHNLSATPLAVVRCFKEDGILSWADVLARKEKSEKAEVEKEKVLAEIAPQKAEEAEQVITGPIDYLLAELGRAIRALSNEFAAEKASLLARQNELLSALSAKEEEAEDLLRLLDTATSPLGLTAQIERNGGEKRNGKNPPANQARESLLPEGLEKRSVFFSCPIDYSRSFVSELLKMSAEDQKKVKEAISLLAEKGAGYNSLSSKPIPSFKQYGVPEGAMASRASRELRFCWHFHKGDGERPRVLRILSTLRRGDMTYKER